MTHEPIPYSTSAEQQAAKEYLDANGIKESQIWVDGAVLRVKEEGAE